MPTKKPATKAGAQTKPGGTHHSSGGSGGSAGKPKTEGTLPAEFRFNNPNQSGQAKRLRETLQNAIARAAQAGTDVGDARERVTAFIHAATTAAKITVPDGYMYAFNENCSGCVLLTEAQWNAVQGMMAAVARTMAAGGGH